MNSARSQGVSSERARAARTLFQEGLLLISLSLEVLGADGGATEILSLSRSEGVQEMDLARLGIPEEIRGPLVNLDLADLPMTATYILAGKGAYRCRVSLIQPPEGAAGEPMLALYLLRDASINEIVDIVAGEHNLTEREHQVLQGLASGLSGQSIAEALCISPNTVKSFLQTIRVKMGAANRGAIMSKLLENPLATRHITRGVRSRGMGQR
jgi:DNA-binding CsgD family transcriptional regulator